MPGKTDKDTAPAAPGGPRWTEYVALGDVRRAGRNAKAHDIARIKSLIKRFGFVGSAVHDGRTDKIVAGHGRLESLEEMVAEGESPPDGIVEADGVWKMPVEYGWSSRSDAEAEALGIALNEATIRGGWDEWVLTEMLRDLDEVDSDLRRVAGWDDEGFGAILESLGPAGGPGGDGEPLAGPEAEPPEDFKSYGDDIPTEHQCPKCGYQWSGKSS